MIKLKPIYSCEDFRSVFNEVAAETNLEQTEQVMQILQTVRKNKDQALREYTAMFDRQEITDFRVPVKLLQESYDALKPSLQDALKFIKQRIESYEIQIRHQDIDLGEFKYFIIRLKGRFYVRAGKLYILLRFDEHYRCRVAVSRKFM